MKLTITAASRVGNVRENNEDMILAVHTFVRDDSYIETVDLDAVDRCMVALADGMGGHCRGEVASHDVLHNLDYFFGDLPVGLSVTDFNEAIVEWLASINNIIDSRGREIDRNHQMGTTLVAFAWYGGEFYWMNCGDSRVYSIHQHQLKQLSTDHSLNTLMGQAEHTSQITNCIGGGCKTSYIDMVDCTQIVHSGDVFMLCSDGLTDMVNDEEIERLINGGADAEALCQAAIHAGGYDNVSVCVIRVQDI